MFFMFKKSTHTLLLAIGILFSSLGICSNALAANNLLANKTEYLAKEPVTVVISGITISNSHRVGIFFATDKPSASPIESDYLYRLSDGKNWKTTAPSNLGNYEFRIFYVEDNNNIVIVDTLPFSLVSKPALAGDLGINNNFFLVKDTVIVNIGGLSAGQIENHAFVGLYLPTDTIETAPYNLEYTNVSYLRDGKTWTFEAPKELGLYEIRVFTSSPAKADTLFGKIPFTVGSTPAKLGDITINKPLFVPNEPVTVTVNGLTQGQINNYSYIGLYYATDALTTLSLQYADMLTLRDGKTWSFNAPAQPGTYEVRVFTSSETAERAASFFGKLTLTVQPSDPSSFHITVTPGKKFTLKKKKSLLLQVTATNSTSSIAANNLATYKSSDSKIVSVSNNGLVVGLKKGKATITVKYGKSTKKIEVTVK